MEQYLDRALAWVQLVGPNVYLQAIAIAIAFIVVGKIADFVISRVIAKLASNMFQLIALDPMTAQLVDYPRILCEAVAESQRDHLLANLASGVVTGRLRPSLAPESLEPIVTWGFVGLAVTSIGRHGTAKAFAALRDIAEDDSDRNVRAAAVRAMGHAAYRDDFGDAVAAFARSSDASVAGAAIQSLHRGFQCGRVAHQRVDSLLQHLRVEQLLAVAGGKVRSGRLEHGMDAANAVAHLPGDVVEKAGARVGLRHGADILPGSGGAPYQCRYEPPFTSRTVPVT